VTEEGEWIVKRHRRVDHDCQPPTTEINGFSEGPNAGIGSIWRCQCEQYWRVTADEGLGLYWKRTLSFTAGLLTRYNQFLGRV
jgi:hypothetical protein